MFLGLPALLRSGSACAGRQSTGNTAVNRLKNGKDTRQPLDGNDLRALRALYRDRKSDEWIFTSERGPFTRDGFAKLLKAVSGPDQRPAQRVGEMCRRAVLTCS